LEQVNGIFNAKRSGWIVRMVNGGCDAVSQYWISCWPVASVIGWKVKSCFVI